MTGIAYRSRFSTNRFGFPANLFCRLSLIAAVLLLCWPCRAATIVLDPGHGGHDSGAVNRKEFAEKQFTLTLAQTIADRLAARHRVDLTRAADIGLSPADRAAKANHLKADLMVSLHAAVTPYCGQRIAAVYFHDDERLSVPSGLSMQLSIAESGTDRPAWNQLQIRHQHQSQQVAVAIKQSLIDSGAFDRVTVSGVPLAPLIGADLPAVLLEVGCMHPSEATTLSMLEQEINAYAQSIAAAIEKAVSGIVP